MISYQPQPLAVDNGQCRANAELAPNCPRCDSSNTKFCYYNNYSLSQPRYLCKACRRYWTKGGALRNIPVGGGCRKKPRSYSKSQRQAGPNIYPHQTPQNSLRPDLVLDGMALGHHLSSSASKSSESDASAGIDMAELYAKFLNPTTSCEVRGKCDNFVAESTLATDQANFSVCERELVTGAHIDQFFDLSSCTADSALTWPGPGEEFGIRDSSVSYQSKMGSEYWNNCNQYKSSLDAMYPA